jgi:hypothetical protein
MLFKRDITYPIALQMTSATLMTDKYIMLVFRIFYEAVLRGYSFWLGEGFFQFSFQYACRKNDCSICEPATDLGTMLSVP